MGSRFCEQRARIYARVAYARWICARNRKCTLQRLCLSTCDFQRSWLYLWDERHAVFSISADIELRDNDFRLILFARCTPYERICMSSVDRAKLNCSHVRFFYKYIVTRNMRHENTPEKWDFPLIHAIHVLDNQWGRLVSGCLLGKQNARSLLSFWPGYTPKM